MSPEQFERWSDFAQRMAIHGWPNATDARKQKIAHEVESFLWMMEPFAADIEDWDGNTGEIYVCDEVSQYCDERGWYHNDPAKVHRFETQFSCCVRAGFDVAVAPSAGVLGFDVGMLRRMWDGDPPAWVAEFFKPPLTPATPDSMAVWL